MVDERNGGRILVDALCSHGTSHVFCVPGESYLPVLDALLDTRSIRMHQEKRYPGRISGTDLVNPDFCKLAVAFGAYAERVKETKEFIPALRRAVANNGPTLIELMVDPNAISPNQTLAEIRAAATINAATT